MLAKFLEQIITRDGIYFYILKARESNLLISIRFDGKLYFHRDDVKAMSIAKSLSRTLIIF